jgi:predicted acetyltransferase
MAVDDELAWRVAEPRRVERKVMDSLWLRLLDIPRALSARVYSEDGCCVFGVRDPFLPENDGNYELTVSSAAARCLSTKATADVSCEVDALGAIFLGGHRASTLARAGRIEGDPSTVALLDRMFASSPLPWCPEMF